MGCDPDVWRDYQILTYLHLTPGEAAEMSAVALDWMLLMHPIVEAKRNERRRDSEQGY